MKFTLSLNGVRLHKEIPTSWDQVTFKTYMQLVDVHADDVTKILSILTGVDEATLNKTKIAGLDTVLDALSFMKSPIPQNLPKEILTYKIPKNLEFQTTGQFKDCQQLLSTFKPQGETLTKEDQLKYLQIVAIYAMPDYCDATIEQQDEFAQKFWDAPCGEVLAVGNFTLLKSIASSQNMKLNLESKIGVLKRLRLAIKIFRLNMVSSIRYWRLRRQLRSQGMSF